mgnify:CR=1 FL=1
MLIYVIARQGISRLRQPNEPGEMMIKLKPNNHFRIFQRKLSAPFFSVLLMLSASLIVVPPSHASNHTSSLETAMATVETLSREFRLDGVVEAINRATVSAQTQGSIQEILFDVDDYVEKGAEIIRLKDTSQQAALKKAQAGEKDHRDYP